MNWRTYAASAIGKGHIDGGTPCQDAFSYAIGNGRLVAVVCDGAGSAQRSEIGAKECSSTISNFLAEQSGTASAACGRDVIEYAVEAARAIIQARAAELNLSPRELACTLVGAVVHEEGGCLFHIGDGVGVVELEGLLPVVSHPENGEYANETYFVTIDDWKNHLRIETFSGKLTCLVLMSDGTMPFAFKRPSLYGPFMNPVKSYLATVSEQDGSGALGVTLGGEGTWKITSDDKTLLVVLPA
jgi:hypothetical protein